MRFLFFAGVLVVITTQAPQAQGLQTVRPTDGIVDGSFIEPYSVSWTSYSVDTSGVKAPGRRVAEKVDTLSVDGMPALKFAQEWYAADGSFQYVNTTVADRNTLQLIKFDSKAPIGGMGHVDFDGVRATGFAAFAPEADHVVIDTVLAEIPFARGLAGLLVAAFPLANGYSATFPVMSWGGKCNQPCDVWFSFKVTGSDTIEIPSIGAVDVWVVEMQNGITYWVTRSSPYLVRAMSTRSNGTKVHFELEPN